MNAAAPRYRVLSIDGGGCRHHRFTSNPSAIYVQRRRHAEMHCHGFIRLQTQFAKLRCEFGLQLLTRYGFGHELLTYRCAIEFELHKSVKLIHSNLGS